MRHSPAGLPDISTTRSTTRSARLRCVVYFPPTTEIIPSSRINRYPRGLDHGFPARLLASGRSPANARTGRPAAPAGSARPASSIKYRMSSLGGATFSGGLSSSASVVPIREYRPHGSTKNTRPSRRAVRSSARCPAIPGSTMCVPRVRRTVDCRAPTAIARISSAHGPAAFTTSPAADSPSVASIVSL